MIFFLNNIIYLSMNNIVKQALTIPYIGLAKFNNHTFKQNRDWKNKKKWKGAVYGFETFPPEFIPLNSWIFIIEMNNETNHIVGIGLIQNTFHPEFRSRIYTPNHDYNNYVFKSPYHIEREQLIKINNKAILFLENILFKGYTHLKRTSCFSLSHNRILIAPDINNNSIKIITKKVYKCSICGLPKKNHICKGKQYIVKNNISICPHCHKPKKRGHICDAIVKNKKNLNFIISFLRQLFI